VRRRVAAARTRDMPAPPCPARPHLILRKLGMGNCLPTAAHLPSTSLDWSRHFSASQNRVLFRRKQSVALSCFHFRRAGLLARTLRPAARRLARRRAPGAGTAGVVVSFGGGGVPVPEAEVERADVRDVPDGVQCWGIRQKPYTLETSDLPNS
jgi:hypothetical protein